MGSQGSLGWDTLGWDTMGGPMGPWDRWDLGLKDPGPQGPWASRTPDHKTDSRYFLRGYFIDTRSGPARARCRGGLGRWVFGTRPKRKIPEAGPGRSGRSGRASHSSRRKFSIFLNFIFSGPGRSGRFVYLKKMVFWKKMFFFIFRS